MQYILGSYTGSFHLKKVYFHNAGDIFLCNLHIAASAYELFAKLYYISRLWGTPRQTDDDDGRTTDDEDDHFHFFMIVIYFLINDFS